MKKIAGSSKLFASFLTGIFATCLCLFLITPSQIKEQDVLDAQHAWKNNIMALSRSALSQQNFEKQVEECVKSLYDVNDRFLFKPTTAQINPVHVSLERTMTYFKGVKDNPISDIVFNNKAIHYYDDKAFVMGHYIFYFQSNPKALFKADYSFVYKKTSNGKTAIILHHSSLTY